MKNIVLIVTLPILLSACASATSRTAAEHGSPALVQASPANKPATARKTATAERQVEDPLPNVELTEDLLYKLLAAEIAYQRGDWQTAFVTMMSTARQTRDPRLARRAAEVALAAKQTDNAFAAVGLWHALAPHSEEATQYFLSLAILSDRLEQAKPILQQRLTEARPQTRGLLALQMQRMLSRAKDKATAFDLLQELLQPYANMPETHLALAQGAYAAGDVGRAQREARIALDTKPDSELAALTLAQVIPDKNDAAASLAEFLRRHPKSHEVRIAYARMLVEQQRFKEAREQFARLLKDDPQDPMSLYALGVLSVQVNDLQAAEGYLTTYLKVLAANQDEDRDPTQALLLLAQIAEERKDSDAQLKWLAQIGPGEAYLGARIKSAQIIAKRGDLEGGRRLLRELKPEDEQDKVRLIMAEGQLLRDANRSQESMATLEAGLKRYPDNTDLLYDYAMAAEKLDRLDAMEKALRRIIQIAPNNQHAYNALGYSLAERNIRLEEAHALIEKALKLAPDDPFIIDSMGWVQFRLGRLKEAETLLRRAYELRPDVEIAVHLGEVLWVKGQKQDAEKFWRDAQTKDPQNDTLRSTLARLNVSL